MDYFFGFIAILLVLSTVVLFFTILFQVFSKNKIHNEIARKYMIYAIIAFLVGFGGCVGGIMMGS